MVNRYEVLKFKLMCEASLSSPPCRLMPPRKESSRCASALPLINIGSVKLIGVKHFIGSNVAGKIP